MLRWLIFSLICILARGIQQAEVRCTAEDHALVEAHLTDLAAADLRGAPLPEIIQAVGLRFLETPYVAHTLEGDTKEAIVVNLHGLDCLTYLENVVVFSRLVAQNQLNFVAFLSELIRLRYRHGAVQGYPSRLHYFSDWLYENTRKGLIEDITTAIGGIPYKKRINFMSNHSGSYPALADPAVLEAILATERDINTRTYHYVPKAAMVAAEGQIANGDLIALTTSIGGLDISHVGFALHTGGRLHFLHASSLTMVVEITTVPLVEYLSKSQTGIMVARLLDPR